MASKSLEVLVEDIEVEEEHNPTTGCIVLSKCRRICFKEI